MDATAALLIYGLSMKMLHKLPPEVLKMVYEAFVRSFGHNVIRYRQDMQHADMAVAGPHYVVHQNGQTHLRYGRFRHSLHGSLDVVRGLAFCLCLFLRSTLAHPACRFETNRLNATLNFVAEMSCTAITNTSVIHLYPTFHQLAILPPPNRLHKLVRVGILIHQPYYDPFSDTQAQNELNWLQNNIQGLAVHAPALRHLTLRIQDKNIYEDQQRRLVRNGQPVSINEEIVDVIRGLSILSGKKCLSARYMYPGSDAMDAERSEVEGIVSAAGRRQVEETVVELYHHNPEQGMVDVTFT